MDFSNVSFRVIGVSLSFVGLVNCTSGTRGISLGETQVNSATETLTTQAPPVSAPAPKAEEDIRESVGYDIVVVAGQSNASNGGLGPRFDELAGLYEARIDTLTCDNPPRLQAATDMNRDCGFNQFIFDTNRIGFAMSFARMYAQGSLSSKRKVLIVAGGVTGSGSTEWLEGSGDLMPSLMSRVQAGLNLPGRNRVIAFLWSQGEADITPLGKDFYPGFDLAGYEYGYRMRLTSIIQRVRTLLNLPQLPFLIGKHAPQWDIYNGFKHDFEAIDASVAAAAGFAAQVDSEGLASNPLCREVSNPAITPCEEYPQYPESDHIHFSAQSQITMGKRFYRKFVEIVPSI